MCLAVRPYLDSASSNCPFRQADPRKQIRDRRPQDGETLKILLILLLLIPVPGLAEPESWMKKEDPEKLAVVIRLMFDCPFSKDEISSITDELMATYESDFYM